MDELMNKMLKYVLLGQLNNLEKELTKNIENFKDEAANKIMNNSPDGLPEEVQNAYKMIAFGAMQMKASAMQMKQYVQVAKRAVENHM